VESGILDAMNYANQDYMHVNYTVIVVYVMLLVTGSQSKNVFLPGYGPIAIADWSIIVNAIYWSNMGFSVYWCSR
jgi:hypothetical protein